MRFGFVLTVISAALAVGFGGSTAASARISLLTVEKHRVEPVQFQALVVLPLPAQINPSPQPLGVANAEEAVEIAENLPPNLPLSPQWIAAVGVLIGAIAFALTGEREQANYQRQRRDLARRLATEFTQKQSVKNVIEILDFEEYRKFGFRHPETGKALFFVAHDARLKRALRSHDQMVKTRQGLTTLLSSTTPPDSANGPVEQEARVKQAISHYENEEFAMEIILRDWFDDFLAGLEHFEASIQNKLITLNDIKPYIRYWIDLIGDRKKRRVGGSSFYDQLSHYIYWAGYDGVQSLFQRFGYKILPPPYNSHDFLSFGKSVGKYDAERALCLAKAAYLVYEDETYVRSVVSNWLQGKSFDDWMEVSDVSYVKTIVKSWLQEGTPKRHSCLDCDFHYINNSKSDTQGFMFRQGKLIVLVFRGSQQFQDWRTNLSLRLMPFRLSAPQVTEPPAGEVHVGFQSAWESVESEVVKRLQVWYTEAAAAGEKPDLWITGHSLGGALAALAAVSLQVQRFQVSGLYTFGQPRVGDWNFVKTVNAMLGDRSYRFVNNNDMVPLIPPQISLINPTRRYGHFGQFRYFDSSGKLYLKSATFGFWPDRLLGFIKGISQAGFEAVFDHRMEFYVANLRKARQLEVDLQKIEADQAALTQTDGKKHKTESAS
ncbi:MAG: lipase family protein [Cyanobacteria bacterium J06642_9]